MMLKNNLKLKQRCNYSVPTFVNGAWYSWFITEKEALDGDFSELTD